MFSMFSPEWVLSEKIQMSGKVITYQNKHRKIAQLCSFDWRQAIDEIWHIGRPVLPKGGKIFALRLSRTDGRS
jgi:hypothetical protein